MTDFSRFKQNASRGMTLVEMLLVMAIFSVVMMAVISLFIPAVRSTAVQTQVTDVQSNLRLGVQQMTRDLLTAGFLVGAAEPIFFESGTDRDPVDFTIRTVAAGSGFGRVASNTTSNPVTLTQPTMVENFPDGSSVRLFEPITATELDSGTIYTISNPDSTAGTFVISDIPSGGISEETVVVRVKAGSPNAIHTIRYRYNAADETLERVIDGSTTQILARNLGAVNFAYAPATGRVSRVDVTFTGQTDAVGPDVLGSAKSRQLQTSVMLRNVF